MSHPVTVSEDTFRSEVLEARLPVLVDFWAEWCGPCRAIAPILEDLATQYAGRVKVAKVDVDAEPGLAGQYGIRSIPTLLAFEHGDVRDQQIGFPGAAALEDLFARLAAGGATASAGEATV